MGKISSLLFGSAILGAAAATVYNYVKNYKELAPERAVPEGEAEEAEETVTRSYSNIDMDAAKEAAKKTFENIKEQLEKIKWSGWIIRSSILEKEEIK